MKGSIIIIAIVGYVLAIALYAFMNVQDSYWAVYHSWVTTYSFLIAIYAVYRFAVQKKKPLDMEIGLLYGMGLIKLFSSIAFNIWFLTSASLTENLLVYMTMVSVSLLVGIIIRYLRYYGKDSK